MPADPPPWVARLTAPTPPDLVAAERHLAGYLRRLVTMTMSAHYSEHGVRPDVARALSARVLDRVLSEWAALDPVGFTVGWHHLLAAYTRRVGVPLPADLTDQLDGDLAAVAGQVNCQHCGAPFTPSSPTQRFCSTRCRVAAHRAQQAP